MRTKLLRYWEFNNFIMQMFLNDKSLREYIFFLFRKQMFHIFSLSFFSCFRKLEDYPYSQFTKL